MEDEIHPVTSSEWELVQRRLNDLENIVTDLKLKLGNCKCNQTLITVSLETQHSDEEETETVTGLNTQSDLPSATSGILEISGQSATDSEVEEILTLARRDATHSADSTSTPITGSNLGDTTSTSTADNTPVSMKSTSSLSNGIGIQKYRRVQVKLTRCDQVEVPETSSSSVFRIANCKSKLTVAGKDSRISTKYRPLLRRKGNGGQAEHTPPTPPSSREKRFGVKSNSTRDVRVLTGDKPFQCNICLKTFTQAAHLKTHTRLHTGDKPFECEFCSKKFNQNSHLTQHRRVHTGDKPFECAFCSKKFRQTSSLAVHMRSHTRERPYACQLCTKPFAQHSQLAVHLRVHTREKPCSCPFCPKGFAYRFQLKKHLTRHPGETAQRKVEIRYEGVS